MSSPLHALNIATMAGWLMFSTASGVGCWVKAEHLLPHLNDERELDITLSDTIDLDTQSEPAAASAAPDAPSTEPELPDPMPVEPIPEIPEVAELEPLPEIPDLPAPKPDDLQTERPKEKARPPAVKPRGNPAAASRPTGAAGSTGNGGGTAAVGNGTAAAGAARLSKGRMPKPNYPSECRSNNQEGRVGITFTVDEQGNVVGAKVSSPCAYPALNQAALDGVYRWKFPPGGRVTASKVLVFKLT